jgi:hypothetical protein
MGAYREQPIIAWLTIGVPVGGLAYIANVDFSIAAGAPLVNFVIAVLAVGAFAPIGDKGILPVQHFPAPVAIIGFLGLALSLRLEGLSRSRELEGHRLFDEAAPIIIRGWRLEQSGQGRLELGQLLAAEFRIDAESPGKAEGAPGRESREPFCQGSISGDI